MYYPPVDFKYLQSITDCTGVIQHGVHSVPNRRLGYTTDDNARALIIATQQYERTQEREDLDLAVKYLSFLHYAENSEHKFQNVMSYNREFLDDEGTEDCYGRVMWACGCAASSKLPENIRIVARKLFEDAIIWAGDLESPRARAYTIMGMYEYLQCYGNGTNIAAKIDLLANTLYSSYKSFGDSEWMWFEPYLTYGNAILALGMLVAADATGRKSYKEAAKDTIRFLTDALITSDRLQIIGNDGWYFRDAKRAWYDQQTIDAGYTVYLYTKAYKIFGEKKYLDLAHLCNSWFFGHNIAGVWVYDPLTKGCYDAITPSGVNLNQGSESTICFLLAQLAMEEFSETETMVEAKGVAD